MGYTMIYPMYTFFFVKKQAISSKKRWIRFSRKRNRLDFTEAVMPSHAIDSLEIWPWICLFETHSGKSIDLPPSQGSFSSRIQNHSGVTPLWHSFFPCNMVGSLQANVMKLLAGQLDALKVELEHDQEDRWNFAVSHWRNGDQYVPSGKLT